METPVLIGIICCMITLGYLVYMMKEKNFRCETIFGIILIVTTILSCIIF